MLNLNFLTLWWLIRSIWRVIVVGVMIMHRFCSVSVSEYYTSISLLLLGHVVDAFNHVVWHRQRGSMCPIDHAAWWEAEEVVTALGVPCGAHRNGSNGARAHAVIVFFMSLHILSKLVFTMPMIINRLSCDDGPWTRCCGYTVDKWERVQPEDSILCHLNCHSRGYTIKR